jgi:hypothetical protein
MFAFIIALSAKTMRVFASLAGKQSSTVLIAERTIYLFALILKRKCHIVNVVPIGFPAKD